MEKLIIPKKIQNGCIYRYTDQKKIILIDDIFAYYDSNVRFYVDKDFSSISFHNKGYNYKLIELCKNENENSFSISFDIVINNIETQEDSIVNVVLNDAYISNISMNIGESGTSDNGNNIMIISKGSMVML